MTNILEKFKLDGRCAIVTGGYRGIGKGIAIALAQAGADIVIAARDKERGGAAAEELAGLGVKSIFIECDISKPEDCKRLTEETIKTFGKIDILVNNAATTLMKKCEDIDYETEWKELMNVNLDGTFLMMQEVGKTMIKQGSGSIINISSISANMVNQPQPQSAYNSSKSAVSMLTKCFAYEWAKYGVRVNAIAPGYVLTELLPDEVVNSETGQAWRKHTPMDRFGTPEEMGGITVFLASDASSYATGGIFTIDGGYSLI